MKGYIYINENGEYAVVTVKETHTSTKESIALTKDINQASVLTRLNPLSPAKALLDKDFTKIRAESTTIVKIIKESDDDSLIRT